MINKKEFADIESIIHSQYRNINGMVVAQKGNIIFESYYNNHVESDKFHVASVTKSVIGTLIGIAIEKGYIQGVEQKVLEFFPEYIVQPSNVQKHNITIRHLLTMTVPYPFEDWQESLETFSSQGDCIKYTLDGLGQNGEIGKFKYSTSGVHLLSAILTRATGKCAREFANEHLFEPIGMDVIPKYEIEEFGYDTLFGDKLKGWAYDPMGYTTGGWGLTLTVRDMAKFGMLHLNEGMWKQKQIIPKAWIKDSIVMHEGENDFMNAKYGYLWWLQDDEVFACVARGDGGNMICCIPEFDLVVAVASTISAQPFDGWEIIKQYILPYIKN